ncbi:MAG: phosphotransferase [Candidatus Sumerlaeaceae bacterium]
MATALQTARLLDYFTIIPDGENQRLLVVPDGNGMWTLPRWRDTDDHYWQAVNHVNSTVRHTWGLKVTTLRCLCNRRNVKGRRDCRIYEMETHGGIPKILPMQARWVSEQEIGSLEISEPEHRLLMRSWFLDVSSPEPHHSRTPWMRRGWIANAVSWMLDQLSRLAILPTGPVEQMRIWHRSAILRVPTNEGYVYFKALPPSPPAADSLAHELISQYAEYLPSHVAVDPHRGWSMIREPGSGSSSNGSSEEGWQEAIQALARIQRNSVNHVKRYLQMGLPDRRVGRMPTRVELLLGDLESIAPHRSRALKDHEIQRLQDLEPRLKSDCARLATYRIPPALEHGDFFAGDAVIQQPGAIFLDWSEAAVSHPFFSVALNSTESDGTLADASVRSRLRDTYLQAWSSFETPDRLLEAFEIAYRLAPLHYAVTLHQMGLPNVETQWEVEVSLPYFLRLLLVRYP